jgi:predicted O-methyltransferase YrrM
LEIGNFEGFSAIWQLEKILTHPTSSITCIDIFNDPVIEERFDRNIEATGVAYKVKKIKGSSEKMLRALGLEQFDYVYIDGSHLGKFVLSDGVLSWDLVKPGGLIVFDDYYYLESRPEGFNPTKIKFLDEYLWKKRSKTVHQNRQLMLFLKSTDRILK